MPSIIDRETPHTRFHVASAYRDGETIRQTIDLLDRDNRMVLSATIVDGAWESITIPPRLATHRLYYAELCERYASMQPTPAAFVYSRS